MRAILPLAAAAISLALAMPAAAAIIINVGPSVLQPEERVWFDPEPIPGLTLPGISNKTGAAVTVTGGETLEPSGGRARLDTADHLISSPFTFHGLTNQLIGFDLTDSSLGFTSTEFRLYHGTATQATLTFVDTAGEVFSQTFGIPANGLFSAQAVGGQIIDYVSIATNGTLGDVRQVRIGGVQAIVPIPEPAAWTMMILGFGGMGSLFRRRAAFA